MHLNYYGPDQLNSQIRWVLNIFRALHTALEPLSSSFERDLGSHLSHGLFSQKRLSDLVQITQPVNGGTLLEPTLNLARTSLIWFSGI